MVRFNDKYTPRHIKNQKVAELFGLVYESMTMAEQEAKFEGLSEFVAQLVEDKELKGKEVRRRPPIIKSRVAPFKFKNHANVLDRTNIIKRGAVAAKRVREESNKNKNVTNGPIGQNQPNQTKRPRTAKDQQTAPPQSSKELCNICGKHPTTIPCRKVLEACYQCEQGHTVTPKTRFGPF